MKIAMPPFVYPVEPLLPDVLNTAWPVRMPTPIWCWQRVLGAALIGIEEQRMPDQPVVGDHFPEQAEPLPNDWRTAISAFEKS